MTGESVTHLLEQAKRNLRMAQHMRELFEEAERYSAIHASHNRALIGELADFIEAWPAAPQEPEDKHRDL